MVEGKKIGVYGLMELGFGLDVGGMKIIVKRDGDYYILNGLKIFIINGGIVDIYVVFVLIDFELK